MIDLPELAPYQARYAALSAAPFRVTAELRNPVVIARDRPNLDNLLARAVVEEATHFTGLPLSDEPYRLPIPLVPLWVAPDGCPLWAATAFVPADDSIHDAIYWHKRQPAGRQILTRSGRWAPTSTDGRHRERQGIHDATVCAFWSADALGDIEEAGRLLAGIVGFGKRRAIGFGAVREWRLEPTATFSLIADGTLLRPVPEAARHLFTGARPVDTPDPLIGWTPPQWKRSLWAAGWPAGTIVA